MLARALPCFLHVLASAAPAAAQSRAPLHIESQSDPMAITLTGPDGIPVSCQTPCALEAEPGPYRLVSEARGLRSTEAHLDMGTDPTDWRVRSGGSAAFVWGVILTTFGSASLGVGSFFVAMPLLSAPDDPYNQMMAGIMGVMTGIISVASLTGGIALIASNTNGVEVAVRPTPGGAAGTLSAPF